MGANVILPRPFPFEGPRSIMTHSNEVLYDVLPQVTSKLLEVKIKIPNKSLFMR